MAQGARVDSIEALRDFKVALWKFQEAAMVALGDAEAEMNRILIWLDTEQDAFWQGQIRKQQEAVTRAKEAVRMKKIFKDATGRQQSAVDEEKALRIAQRKLEEAQQKLSAVRRWSRALQKEIEMYKGSVQRFATTVHADLPAAAAHIESLSAKLDAYVSLQSEFAGAGAEAFSAAPAPVGEASMARGAASEAPQAQPQLALLRTMIPSSEERAQATPLVPKTIALLTVARDFDELPSGLSLRVEDNRAASRPCHGLHESLSAVNEMRTAPPDQAKIFVAESALRSRTWFLHRVPPSSGEDSGWSIAGTEASAPGSWHSMPVADLLRDRPILRDLLALPPGFSVMLDAAGVAAVFAPDQAIVWQRPPE